MRENLFLFARNEADSSDVETEYYAEEPPESEQVNLFQFEES